MSTSFNGFILTGSSNSFEVLNTVVLSFVQLCSRNTIFNKNAHPFKNPTLSIETNYCFFVSFTNDREADRQKYRKLQIGVYEDQFSINPVGTKVSLSIGNWGDYEFIMKSALENACRILKSDRAYYLPPDTVENAYCQYKELLFDNV